VDGHGGGGRVLAQPTRDECRQRQRGVRDTGRAVAEPDHDVDAEAGEGAGSRWSDHSGRTGADGEPDRCRAGQPGRGGETGGADGGHVGVVADDELRHQQRRVRHDGGADDHGARGYPSTREGELSGLMASP
jgi:hypothetical protein